LFLFKLSSREKNSVFLEQFLFFFNVDIGVGQGSALSSILSALYLASVLHILEKHLKNLKILVFILSFVENGLLITQRKSLTISKSLLFYSYNITSSLLEKLSLIIEHGKTEVFHFLDHMVSTILLLSISLL